jgi:hypothetical protein
MIAKEVLVIEIDKDLVVRLATVLRCQVGGGWLPGDDAF